MDQAVEPILETQPLQKARFAGLWRRIGAAFIDAAVLAVLGLPLGLALGEHLAPAGTPARLVGLLVVVPYLGVLGGRVGGGQTVGKRLTGLRVVDRAGQLLSMPRAFARAGMLALPYVVNGIHFSSMGPGALALIWMSGLVALGLGGAIVGTVLLNRPTRQGFHDLVVGSYVVGADGSGLLVAHKTTRRPIVASVVWVTFVAVASGILITRGANVVADQFPPALLDRLLAIPGVASFAVQRRTSIGIGGSSKDAVEFSWSRGVAAGATYSAAGDGDSGGEGGTSTAIIAVVWFQGSAEDVPQAAAGAASALLLYSPDVDSCQRLVVTVIRGWDVGVVSWTTALNFTKTPSQWRAELDM